MFPNSGDSQKKRSSSTLRPTSSRPHHFRFSSCSQPNFAWGGLFSFLEQKSASKLQKHAILQTFQPPPLAMLLIVGREDVQPTDSFIFKQSFGLSHIDFHLSVDQSLTVLTQLAYGTVIRGSGPCISDLDPDLAT